jgi:hypothetical protein
MLLTAVRTAVSTMVIVQEKAFCVIWLSKNKSIVTVQHDFHYVHGRDPPVSKVI